LPEPGRVPVSPHRLAGGQVVAGDDLVLAALLLGVEEVAADREGRPAWSDGAAPQRDRRRLRPVGLDPHAANDAVADGSAESRPSGLVSPPQTERAASRESSRMSELTWTRAAQAVLAPGAAVRASPRRPLPEWTDAPPARRRPEPGAVVRESSSTANEGPNC